jgi:hypothetical protein
LREFVNWNLNAPEFVRNGVTRETELFTTRLIVSSRGRTLVMT